MFNCIIVIIIENLGKNEVDYIKNIHSVFLLREKKQIVINYYNKIDLKNIFFDLIFMNILINKSTNIKLNCNHFNK